MQHDVIWLSLLNLLERICELLQPMYKTFEFFSKYHDEQNWRVSEKEMRLGCMTIYGQSMNHKIFVSVTEDRRSD